MTGDVGPTGPTGTATGSMVFTANAPLSPVTSVPSGGPDFYALMPLSGTLASPQQMQEPFSMNDTLTVMQVIPRDGVVSSINGWLYTTSTLNLVGTTISLTGGLYTSEDGFAEPVQQPATLCTASPALTGVVPPRQVSTFACDNIGLDVSAGEVGFFAVEANATGVSLNNSLSLRGSMSMVVD